jgi:hypothetical protein
MALKDKRKQLVGSELEGLRTGDARRDARGRQVAERLAHGAGKSLPQAMRSDAELEGAYRHLGSESVTLTDILQPQVARARARVLEAGEAYALHDTTDFLLGGRAQREGLGPVNGGGDQGFLAHVTLGVSADGERLPLGLLALGTRVRSHVGAPTGEEVGKWKAGVEMAAQGLPLKALVHVGDRETDAFPVLHGMVRQEYRFIFRAAQDRVVFDEAGEHCRLFEAVAAPDAFMCEVEAELGERRRSKHRPPKDAKSHPARKRRTALLTVSAQRLSVKRPRNGGVRGLPATLTLNVVRAYEAHPPEGEVAVDWLLFTSEPIDTEAQVLRVVEGYRTRWLIEEYFKALKTGLKYEESQLESAHSLFNLLGYCCAVAYALLLLRALSRTKAAASRPADFLFTPAQLSCLRAFSKRVALPPAPSLRDALLAVAGLGGHLKRNGEPGWQTLSAGYSQLLAYEQGYLAAMAQKSDQS